MSVKVRPAAEADIDGVVDLLYGHMSQKFSRERWRTLLDYPWRPPDADRGFVAVDDGRVVGFMGLVYVDRPVAGRMERFCNVCAWYLLREYRTSGVGMELQRRSIADKRLTYTVVTARAGTDRVFRSTGFQVLDAERYVLHRRDDAPRIECVEGADAVEPFLSPEEQLILGHHCGFDLRHLLLRADGRACYLVVQARKQGEDVNYHQVMHASDFGFVAAHGQAIADTILEPGRAVFAVDRRFMRDSMYWETETMRQPRLFLTPHVPPAAIDHLYNEVVLLDQKLP